MTVSYQSDVASSTSGGLIRLLWRWRGSVWKLVYKELLLFLLAYAILAFSYDFIFPDSVKRLYEKIVIVCSAFVDMIPLSFILGFYVSFTASRWWHQYTAIPWPDKIMNNIAMYIPGVDEDSRILRRTLMRYLNLTLVLVLRSISIAVKRRFPTKEHLVEAGFMTKPELEMFSAVPATEFNTFWIPCTWFVNLLRDARQECRITDSSGLKLIMEEFNEFRSKCGLLWSYDWVSIPLVYTQVVTLSTYAFFVASVFGRQHINPPKYPDLFLTEIEHRGEFYIPVFTILQFLLYMGLLKLGEQLINPFGDDDEDFELNWIIDRHIKVSFLGVDVLNGNPPPIMKDNYFDESDIKLPYTAAAVSYKKKTYRGSMATYHVPSEQQGLVVPDFEEDDDTQDPDHQSLLKSDARSRDSSLWSMIGSKVKQASASILSLDSENLEALDERASELGWHSTLSLSPQEIAMGEMQNGRGHRESTGEAEANEDLAYPPGEDSRGRDRLDSLTLFKKRSQLAAPGALTSDGSSSNLHLPQEQHQQQQQQQQLQLQQQQQSQLPRQQSSDKLAPFDPTLGFFSSMFPSKESTSPRKSSSASTSVSKEALAALTPNLSRSSSNASKTLPHAMPRLPRAAIIKLRKADPKLTIRPFRSKVTFSEDTKGTPTGKTTGGMTVGTAGVTSSPQSIYHVPMAKPSRGMRQEGLDLTISSPELSEADLLAAYIEHRDNTIRAAGSTRSSGLLVPPLSPLRTNKPPPLATILTAHRQQSTDPYPDGSSAAPSAAATSPSSTCKTPSPLGARKASLGSEDVHSPLYPADLINAIGLPSEYWLRHQSLPNIQEICEDVSSTASGPVPSPTGRSPFKRTSPTSMPTSPATSEVSRGSIRRQVAQDKPSPPKEPGGRGSKGSLGGPSGSRQLSAPDADEKRRRYSSNTNSGSGNSLGSHSSNTVGASLASSAPTARRYRKKGSSKPGSSSKSLHSLASTGSTKQSSTESEGSFVTAKSYYIQISEEDENQHPHHSHQGDVAGSSASSPHPSAKCDLCHQQVSSSPSLGDDSTTITPSSTLSGKSTKPSLIDLKKSSHSTSSSVASYSSAKDIFFKFPPSSSLDSSPSGSSNLQQQQLQQQQSNANTNSLNIPTIVVMKSSPSSVSSNNQQSPSQSTTSQVPPLNQSTQLDVAPEKIIDESQSQRGNGSHHSEDGSTSTSQATVDSSSFTPSTTQVTTSMTSTTSTNSSPSNLT